MDTSDIFKHENNSVDLLLQEMKVLDLHGAVSILDPNLTVGSPTKPLSFKNQDKDYNSSSDTYVSDSGAVEVVQTEPPHEASFERNFETSDLENELLTDKSTVHNSDAVAADNDSVLPNKSIMRPTGTPSSSPKKSVAFPAEKNLETLHTYSPAPDQDTLPSSDANTSLTNSWKDIEHDITATPPPVPPPHTSSTITGLLSSNGEVTSYDDTDLSELSPYRPHDPGSLPLNEQMDIYLGAHGNDDLDMHLDDLDRAKTEETNVNIHRLSFQLDQYDEVESPLNALIETHEVHLRSAGSSQSSLQSLMDLNRFLESANVAAVSRGIEFTGGIRRFPDKMARLIIPPTDVGDDDANDMLTFGVRNNNTHDVSERSDESINLRPVESTLNRDVSEQRDSNGHDAYDQSYNLTEKSIMNLLNSASQVYLPEPVPNGSVQHEPLVKTEPDSFVKTEPDSFVQPEPESSVKADSFVKTESVSFVKAEPNSFVKEESYSSVDESFIKTEPNSFQNGSAKDSPETAQELELELDEIMHGQPDKEEASLDLSSQPVLPQGEISNTDTPQQIIVTTSSQKVVAQTPHRKLSQTDGTVLSGLLQFDTPTKANTSDSQGASQVSAQDSVDDIDFPDDSSIQILSTDVAIRSSHQVKLVMSDANYKTATHSQSPNSSDDGDIDEQNGNTLVKLETEYKLDTPDSSGTENYEDTSEGLTGKTLAPQKMEHSNSIELDDINDNNIDVLANSSNIFPPSHLLPPVTTSRKLDPGPSFEESLSAEHDKEKKNIDYLSIWHSQLKKRKEIVKSDLTYRVPSLLGYNMAELSKPHTYNIPASLQKKMFKEVNVLSKRVVSAGYEDFLVSDFLPEISQGSALGDHFEDIMHRHTIDSETSTTSVTQKKGRRKSMGTTNMLSLIDDSIVEESPEHDNIQKKRHSIHTLRPMSVTVNEVTPRLRTPMRRSKFHVPSFEIKRTNSVLSPKNLYNDIFNDTVLGHPPTIKASGMKTLPSMDKDDVKRIMQMKHAMSQEEYSNLKLIDPKRRSVIQEPAVKYDKFQQLASLHCDSLMSTAPTYLQKRQLSHVMGELSAVPVALESKDQIIRNSNIKADSAIEPTKNVSRASLINRKTDNLVFPDPDPDLISALEVSPVRHRMVKNSIIKEENSTSSLPRRKPIPIKVYAPLALRLQEPEKLQEPVTLQEPVKFQKPIPEGPINSSPKKIHTVSVNGTPTAEKKVPRSPIKINSSPVKVVKRGTSVTGVVIEGKKFEETDLGAEITYDKIRDHQKHNALDAKQDNIHTLELLRTVSDSRVASDYKAAPSNSTSPNMVVGSKVISGSRVVSQKSGTSFETDRGKLFLRVVGLKNIKLPEIQTRNCSFSLTLDNGVHCIKTPNYNVHSLSVLIGKEFELTVGSSLEFILTMKATYDKPRGILKEVKETKVVKSKNKIGRLFGSKEIITTTRYVPQEVVDPWKFTFAADGSFARCYFDLERYELQITGIARNFNVTCFNEWATVSQGGQVMQREPYQIAQLEVKMLFVPRTESYEVLPTSIKSAYESLDELRDESHLAYEGYMHQDGGDCETWKKRWFTLSGTSLVAYSEFSHKSRAKINLAKVVEVIYVDKENVHRLSANYRNFSDIMLVENAFKIRFANGEIIDFGAPNKEEKLHWIKLIQEIVYRNKFRCQPWIQLMQAKNGNSRPRSIMAT